MTVDVNTIYIEPYLAHPQYTKIKWRGVGHIAGEAPSGRVTIDGVPGVAEVRLHHRESGRLLKVVQSAPDGTYRFDGLNTQVKFDVVGRKDGFNDVIVSNVQPAAP